MQIIERKEGSFDDLIFTVDLTDYGKTNADVVDIFFVVKKIMRDADDDYMLKSHIDGSITYMGTDILTVSVSWNNDEYDKVTIGEWLAALLVKFSGDPLADENVNTYFKLKIIPGILNEH